MKILNEILQELIQIRKELRTIRSSEELKFNGDIEVKNGIVTSRNSSIHDTDEESR